MNETVLPIVYRLIKIYFVCSLLRGAEELGLKKQVKSEYGGGMREFIFDEQDCFAGIDEEKSFLSSQERQSVVRMFLYELRATDGEQLDRIHFRGGQPISRFCVDR